MDQEQKADQEFIEELKSLKREELSYQKSCTYSGNIEIWVIDIAYMLISVLAIISFGILVTNKNVLPQNELIIPTIIIFMVLLLFSIGSKVISYFAFNKAYLNSQNRVYNYDKVIKTGSLKEYNCWYDSEGLKKRQKRNKIYNRVINSLNLFNYFLLATGLILIILSFM